MGGKPVRQPAEERRRGNDQDARRHQQQAGQGRREALNLLDEHGHDIVRREISDAEDEGNRYRGSELRIPEQREIEQRRR